MLKWIFCAGFLLSILSASAREGTEWMTAYWYNGNDDRLPRILLIGDSICNGYQTEVRDELAGTAYVSFYATSKCVTDRSYLKELSYILDEYDYAVIHFNNGLHSLTTDPAKWEAGLRAALHLIQEKGKNAKIIWASSTPLKDARLTAQVRTLNAIAEKTMRENNIPVDDLFALMDPLDRNQWWKDTYHYTPEGRKMQAKQVAAAILSAMGKKPATKTTANSALQAAASETGPDGKIK